MSYLSTAIVMDVSPWPQGKGFAGSAAWWDYVLSQEEKQRLDNLLGIALLDKDICERLVNKRDRSLLRAFKLSDETQDWLQTIKATTLKEFAQAILAAS